jgi:SAM-dependent methyltransferase
MQPQGDTMDVEPEPKMRDCACPTDAQIARHFDAKVAERVAQGQDPGLVAASESLSKALLSLDPTNSTVLELGCGRGGLLLRLVEAGAARATGVDLSPTSIEAAGDRFRQAQRSDRVQLSVGDAARVSLDPHDWVILDRVICCYADVERLLANSLPAARHVYAFTVPNSRGWRGVAARLQEWFEHTWDTLHGRGCPGYVHDLDLIERRLASAGFRLRHRDRHGLWYIAVYERRAD